MSISPPPGSSGEYWKSIIRKEVLVPPSPILLTRGEPSKEDEPSTLIGRVRPRPESSAIAEVAEEVIAPRPKRACRSTGATKHTEDLSAPKKSKSRIQYDRRKRREAVIGFIHSYAHKDISTKDLYDLFKKYHPHNSVSFNGFRYHIKANDLPHLKKQSTPRVEPARPKSSIVRPWTEDEKRIVEKHKHQSSSIIVERLEEAGFTRTRCSVYSMQSLILNASN